MQDPTRNFATVFCNFYGIATNSNPFILKNGKGVKTLLAIERKNQILAILQDEKKVVVTELSTRFDVSEETIRRDLDKLEKEGYIKKAYGGAVLNDNQLLELPFIVRKKANVEEKQKIAEIIAEEIYDGDKIILDASSTALFVLRKIKEKKNITLITNSVEILLEATEISGWNVFSTGGRLQEGSLALFGPSADKMLLNYHADKAIISCKGIDIRGGLTDSNELHAVTKYNMLNCANKKIVVADSSKFDKIAFSKIDDIKNLDMIITNVKPSLEWTDYCQRNDIDLIFSTEEE